MVSKIGFVLDVWGRKEIVCEDSPFSNFFCSMLESSEMFILEKSIHPFK